MLIVRSIPECARLLAPGTRHAVTIGNFDGVHTGHRTLIRVTREKAAAATHALGHKVLSALVTFDPHPAHIVRGVAGPGILTPLPRKLALLEQTGLDMVLVLPFTRETARTSAGDFVQTVLVDLLRASDLVTGYNFALGKDREGDYAALCRMGETHDFSVTQIPPILTGGEIVSSSRIREHIRAGNMEQAAALLGRKYSVDGGIIHGQARGRKLGFPTANIDYGKVLLPPRGAYAGWLQLLGGEGGDAVPLMSMTSVGTNPTFGDNTVTVETHVLDFSGDLYGKTVRLFFSGRLRGEIPFKRVEDLICQLHDDAAAARAMLEREGTPPCERCCGDSLPCSPAP